MTQSQSLYIHLLREEDGARLNPGLGSRSRPGGGRGSGGGASACFQRRPAGRVEGESAMSLNEILREAVQREASDVLLIAGLPVSYKVNGHICREGERLFPEHTRVWWRSSILWPRAP